MPRTFNQSHPLGQVMAERGMTLKRFSAEVNIDNRKLSDYLANRVPIFATHLYRMAEVLECDVEDILPLTDPRYTSRTQAYDTSCAIYQRSHA